MHRPKIPKNPKKFGTIRRDPDKVPKNLGILGLCMNPALCSSGFSGILSLYRFCSL